MYRENCLNLLNVVGIMYVLRQLGALFFYDNKQSVMVTLCTLLLSCYMTQL